MLKKEKSSAFIRFFIILWLLCIVAFAGSIGFATNWFKGTVQDTPFGNSTPFLIIMLTSMGLGIIAFCIFVLIISIKLVKGDKSKKGVHNKKNNFFGSIFKLIFNLAFFPLILLYRSSGLKELKEKIKVEKFKLSVLRPKSIKQTVARIFSSLAVIGIILPIWILGYFLAFELTKDGLGYSPEIITVSGTGSMSPTFPKGQGKTPEEQSKEIVDSPGMFRYPNGLVIFGKRYFNHELSRGDIVVLLNDKTKELTEKLYGRPSGWVKRVVGMPGDTIELKNGIVYLNDQPQKEPYTAQAHSTFGQSYLKECQKVTIPENSVFVMGDNRKGSGDSREIGFININDINHVLPLEKQKGVLDKNWRDTSLDLEESSKIKIDKQKYLDLLNEKRAEAKVKALKYQPKLEDSASRRGEVMLEFDDFSYEATKSGYPMTKAMRDSKYSNTTYGEALNIGYYEAEELIENQFEFPDTKKFLLDKNYQEVGIAEVEGMLNGCPSQVIVLHFAGYIPPNYSKEVVDSWVASLNRLKEIRPSWENIRSYSSIYESNKKDADRLIEIMNIRIGRMEKIVSKMQSNQWLSAEENRWIDEDQALFNEQEVIAKRLNDQTWR